MIDNLDHLELQLFNDELYLELKELSERSSFDNKSHSEVKFK